ncbi:ferritin subunit-like [Teleopsis dalmanni]|uniref:ferritin subunit-like n=1 Tax=Teleopsis dalmanni TaxID=139649 RepID=UPI0018CE734D|nr:ferritin subunit-like [Teleopsis dalmanni]
MHILNFATILLFVGLYVSKDGFGLEINCFNSQDDESDNPICEIFDDWIDLQSNSICYGLTIDQIHMEFDACYTYLDMANHFSGDTVNRPGVADFFFKSARDEREHGIKLIEYLSMRGQLNNVTNLVHTPNISVRKWKNVADAVRAALALETKVAKAIRNLIKACESEYAVLVENELYNFYHMVDFLTEVYMEEQLRSQRELAAMLSTLTKLETSLDNGLGEFMYDKSLM